MEYMDTTPDLPTGVLDRIDFGEDGLIPAIAQDAVTGEVRMQAFANREALSETLRTGYAHYWSRSRQELWKKGETSGNLQRVRSVRADCDQDSLLYLIEQEGVTCHTGKRHCFHVEWNPEDRSWEMLDVPRSPFIGSILGELQEIIEQRDEERPEGSYTTTLLEEDGDKPSLDRILEKVGEEALETILAAKNDEAGPFSEEAADLLYHLLVLCRKVGVTIDELAGALERRR